MKPLVAATAHNAMTLPPRYGSPVLRLGSGGGKLVNGEAQGLTPRESISRTCAVMRVAVDETRDTRAIQFSEQEIAENRAPTQPFLYPPSNGRPCLRLRIEGR